VGLIFTTEFTEGTEKAETGFPQMSQMKQIEIDTEIELEVAMSVRNKPCNASDTKCQTSNLYHL
jgi:hypothetical protein